MARVAHDEAYLESVAQRLQTAVCEIHQPRKWESEKQAQEQVACEALEDAFRKSMPPACAGS